MGRPVIAGTRRRPAIKSDGRVPRGFEHERKVGLVLTRGAICVCLLGNRCDWAERALDASVLWIFRSLTLLPLVALSGILDEQANVRAGGRADIPMQGPYGPFPLTAEHLQDGSDSMI